ncbi:hypothetical protein BDN70DRAFT_888735 [Pholiota conissans]|uniref:Uncharacterized protein n=1 Tax=Pholiota conissans TaxID=109636 RepID=A0A9P5YNF9_9AGAR|nr:hypothetical protein BDN70DRAFT_888735 [Pholiota conissans]
MIIDDKVIMPPYYDPTLPYPASPAYPYPSHSLNSPAPSSYGSTVTLSLGHIHSRPPALTLASLPPHILLQIIHHTFPYSTPQVPAYHSSASAADAGYQAAYTAYYHPDTIAERQRRTLLWLSKSLRPVNRTLYTACMHVLRSTYLPAYIALVRPPYTSDPFPMDTPAAENTSSPAVPPPAYDSPTTSSTSLSSRQPSSNAQFSPLISPQRETPILDRFILLKIRNDVLADESSLHLDREDAFRDLFEVAQPRARLEDLVREIGLRRGVVYVPGWGTGDATTSDANGSLLALVGAQPEAKAARMAAAVAAVEIEEGPAMPKKKPTSTKKSFFASFSRKNSPASSPPPTRSGSLFSSSRSSSSAASSTSGSQYAFSEDSKLSPPTSPTSPPPQYPSSPPGKQIQPIPFTALSISFQPRRIGLLLGRQRTIAEVPRAPGRRETLEVLAARLVVTLEREMRSG